MTRTLGSLTAALAVFTVLAVAPDHATAKPTEWWSQPATREHVANELFTRHFHITDDELRRDYPDDCFVDRDDFTSRRSARRACFLEAHGYMTGRLVSDGYPVFDPTARIRRDQIASLLWRIGSPDRITYPKRGRVFEDVAPSNVHDSAIRYGKRHGLILGTTAVTFSPGEPVTRRQVRKFSDRLLVHMAVGGQW